MYILRETFYGKDGFCCSCCIRDGGDCFRGRFCVGVCVACFLKPTGCILRRLRLLTPAMLVLATLASFWLVFNNLLDKTLAVWSFVGGVLALCGLIFDVLAGPRNNE